MDPKLSDVYLNSTAALMETRFRNMRDEDFVYPEKKVADPDEGRIVRAVELMERKEKSGGQYLIKDYYLESVLAKMSVEDFTYPTAKQTDPNIGRVVRAVELMTINENPNLSNGKENEPIQQKTEDPIESNKKAETSNPSVMGESFGKNNQTNGISSNKRYDGPGSFSSYRNQRSSNTSGYNQDRGYNNRRRYGHQEQYDNGHNGQRAPMRNQNSRNSSDREGTDGDGQVRSHHSNQDSYNRNDETRRSSNNNGYDRERRQYSRNSSDREGTNGSREVRRYTNGRYDESGSSSSYGNQRSSNNSGYNQERGYNNQRRYGNQTSRNYSNREGTDGNEHVRREYSRTQDWVNRYGGGSNQYAPHFHDNSPFGNYSRDYRSNSSNDSDRFGSWQH